MKRGHWQRWSSGDSHARWVKRSVGGHDGGESVEYRKPGAVRAPRPPRERYETVLARSRGVSGMLVRCASQLFNVMRMRRLPEHRRRIGQSRAVLRAVRQFEGEGYAARCLAYLRNVDPLVFEEVVLSSLEDAGLFVLRNAKYSGDGGIDGKVWLPGYGWCAVQSKRYGGHVNHHHVAAFGEAICHHGFRAGLFLHTGRSGAAVYPHLTKSKVVLVSGASLVQLVLGRRAGEVVWR
ncbi:restriction endonuclease [Janthinobacterium sp. SUN100]|uniref:restriction endonuclease n=1 Tax=Janthinobacterium sp. SUN100 TaxID=3004101 RepID=UPI0025AF2498|nr:restriction endonuclease [Janthinobacterium sp. SUN100]MDN2700393.1 restriction endonuclease [Janthinobacterium sp. SUN100]